MKTILSIICIFSIAFVISCTKDENKKAEDTKKTESQQKTEEVAFYINDRPVYKSDLKYPRYADNLNDEILYEAALAQGLDKDEKMISIFQKYKKNLLIGHLKGRVIKEYEANNPVNDEQIAEYYEENKDQYTFLDLKRVLVTDKQKAAELHKQLSESEDPFKTLETLKDKDSDIKLLELNNSRRYNKEFNKLEKGAVSNLVPERKSFSIFIINAVNTRPLEEVKHTIKYSVAGSNKLTAINEYIKKAKVEYKIKVKKVI